MGELLARLKVGRGSGTAAPAALLSGASRSAALERSLRQAHKKLEQIASLKVGRCRLILLNQR